MRKIIYAAIAMVGIYGVSKGMIHQDRHDLFSSRGFSIERVRDDMINVFTPAGALSITATLLGTILLCKGNIDLEDPVFSQIKLEGKLADLKKEILEFLHNEEEEVIDPVKAAVTVDESEAAVFKCCLTFRVASEPTDQTIGVLRSKPESFRTDDRYQIPDNLWNWSAQSQENFDKAIEVGKNIYQGRYNKQVDDMMNKVIRSEKDGFIVSDAIREFLQNLYDSYKGFDFNSQCRAMQCLYQLADEPMIDGQSREAAWMLYVYFYEQMLLKAK
ncbi:MAG: hypothetical protein LBB21_04945 [Holosporaceae bacterium]|nr:hypothetical protein [Holosporaceae bacterium]